MPGIWVGFKTLWPALQPGTWEESLVNLSYEIEEQETSLKKGWITFIAPAAGKEGRAVKAGQDPLEEHRR